MPSRPPAPPSPPLHSLIGAVALVVLMIGAGAACSGHGADDSGRAPADRGQVVASLVDDVIVPGEERLALATEELASATEDLCASPSSATLGAAREAWDQAQSAWSSTAAYRLGPVRWLRLGARIEYPVDTTKIDELAVGPDGPDPTSPSSLAELGADVRGLDAVQHLLFTPPGVGQLSSRQCAYAASAAILAADGAGELLVAWVEGVDGDAPAAQQLVETGGDSMWGSTTEALEDLLNTSLSVLTMVADSQLGPATGETTGQPEPRKVDAGAAHRALADVADELRSAQMVYGDSTAEAPSGLSVLVAAAAPSTSDGAIRTDLGRALDAVASMRSPLHDLDASGTSGMADRSLVEAYQHTLGARSALSTEVASLLGLTISFSDSDGDS